MGPFSPDLVNGHFTSHAHRHDPIRLSNEAMDIMSPAQLSGQSTPQVRLFTLSFPCYQTAVEFRLDKTFVIAQGVLCFKTRE